MSGTGYRRFAKELDDYLLYAVYYKSLWLNEELLHPACVSPLAERVSRLGQLLAFRRVAAASTRTLVCLSAHALWPLHRHRFVDATKISVCHNRRIGPHKVLADIARRGKTSVDWFYGFKLYLVVNDCGQLLGVNVTVGKVDDRQPVPELVAGLFGKL